MNIDPPRDIARPIDLRLTGNPLARASHLPFGLPPFTQVRPEHFGPAFEAGMTQQLAEIGAITSNREPPTFENTLVAMERTGRLLARTANLFFNLVSAASTPEIRALEKEFAPKLAEHSDRIRLNPDLFARIDAVNDRADELSGEDRALLDRYHLDFVLAGARLDPAGHGQLREINGRLSRLSTQFQQNLQAATESAALVLTDVAELDGLSTAEIAGAAAEASARGHDGAYLIPLVLP